MKIKIIINLYSLITTVNMLVKGKINCSVLLYQYCALCVLYPTFKFLLIHIFVLTYLCLQIKDLEISVSECRILAIIAMITSDA